ncbi:MAG: hypothetical protein KIT87_11410 [Anaerolineae bacterium]|nr:hypothetical protein [Anaerolineae bacterium]
MRGSVLALVLLTWLGLAPFARVSAPVSTQAPHLAVLNREGVATVRVTDGDQIRVRLTGAPRSAQTTTVSFTLEADPTPFAHCTLVAQSEECQTEPFLSLGWYWDPQGQPRPNRRILAAAEGRLVSVTLDVQVAPRPVVLVHGLNSSAAAWRSYLGPAGFLARLGLSGYAVGDGQAAGVLNTGSLDAPTRPTNTVAANAKILADYISGVKRVTGAQQVDLVAHSLGGLISRYYIAQLMPTRDVGQLITLGSPHQGTDCANLPLALGFYLPATLEIRTSYMRDIFNRLVVRRAGVSFYAIAGTRIFDNVGAPCTEVPSDLLVGQPSAAGIQAPSAQAPVLHTDLNDSPQVFDDLVAPRLRQSIGGFPNQPDPSPDVPAGEELQFTRIFTGHVASGASIVQRVHIDQAAVASFALFDPTQSLTVTVRGASGNILPLTPANNGLIVVDAPETLVYLGYGFRNPRPGPWEVTLQATSHTPPQGVDFALTARLVGGATLQATTSALLPRLGETVTLSARLELGGQNLSLSEAVARIRRPDGQVQGVPLAQGQGQYQGQWRPDQPGLHSVDVVVTGSAPDGSPIERTAFLTVEVQPAEGQVQTRQLVALGSFALVLVLGIALWLRRRTRR